MDQGREGMKVAGVNAWDDYVAEVVASIPARVLICTECWKAFPREQIQYCMDALQSRCCQGAWCRPINLEWAMEHAHETPGCGSFCVSMSPLGVGPWQPE